MATKTNANPATKNYAKIGIIAAIVIAIAAGGTWLVSSLNGNSGATVEESLEKGAEFFYTMVEKDSEFLSKFKDNGEAIM